MKTHCPIKYATLLPIKAVQKNSYEIIDRGQVDNEQWYVVQAEPKVALWMRTQNKDLWYDYKVGSYRVLDTFDVHEKLYTMLALRWA
jgi:hypothetical protein